MKKVTKTLAATFVVGGMLAAGSAAAEDKKPAAKAKAEEEVGKYGVVLRGVDEGALIVVEMVRIGPKAGDEVIMRVMGVDDPIDYKVIRYKKVNSGSGFDYVDGKIGRLIERERYGSTSYELWVDGKTYQLVPDQYLQQQFHPLHLRTEFEQQKAGEVTAAMQHLKRFDSDDGRPEVSRYGLVFTGTGEHANVQVSLLRYGPKKDSSALLRFSGIDTDLDGKVRKVKVNDMRDRGADYVDGDYTRMTARRSYGATRYELYVDGKTIPLMISAQLSAGLNGQHFLTDYLKETEEAKKAKKK